MTYQNAYKILELSPAASQDEIKQAYKTAAKKYHPDIYKGDKKFAEEKMKQINEAYELLSKTSNSLYQQEYDESIKRQKDFEEFIKKRKEADEKLKKELEEIQKEREAYSKKVLKPIVIFLCFLLEYFLILLLHIAIESAIYYYNETQWFFFGYFILLTLIALIGVIGSPFAFRWFLKKFINSTK